MNTYYFYRSYRLGGRILGTLGCSLAWAFFRFRLVELSSRRPFTVPVASRYYGQALFSHNHFFFHLLGQQHFTQGNTVGIN